MNETDLARIERARRAFQQARQAADPILDEVFPFQLRLDGRPVDARGARRRVALAAASQRTAELARIGAVVLTIAWLLLDWPPAVPAIALALVPLTWWLARRAARRARPVQEWLDRAEVVAAAVVAAHASLHEDGTGPAPASLLVSFEPTRGNDAEHLRRAARACAALTARPGDLPEAEAKVRDWLRESGEYQRFDRVAVPPSLGGGPGTFLVGTVVYRHQLDGGRMHRALYPMALRRDADEAGDLLPAALAEPGPGGT